MIYLTGDTHGGIDVRKLLVKEGTSQLTANDYLIICGDFGFVWKNKKESHKEKQWLDWFAKMPWTTLFVDGNHENFPQLFTYPQKEWNGGLVHEIRPNLFHLMRSQRFTIEGSTFFTLGGAASHDRGPAVGDPACCVGKGWWPEEIPSAEEFQQAKDVLKDGHVDYIVTHCLPTSMQKIIKGDTFKADPLTDFLQTIKETVRYQHWYCGHYHMDIDLCANFSVLYQRIVPLGDTVASTAPMMGSPIYRIGDEVIYLKNNEVFCGTIRHIFPWGKNAIRNQPAYEIEESLSKEKENLAEDQILGYSI